MNDVILSHTQNMIERQICDRANVAHAACRFKYFNGELIPRMVMLRTPANATEDMVLGTRLIDALRAVRAENGLPAV